MKFEFVVTAGEGTLIKYGVADRVSVFGLEDDIQDIAIDAILDGHAIQLEPAPDNCETGQ